MKCALRTRERTKNIKSTMTEAKQIYEKAPDSTWFPFYTAWIRDPLFIKVVMKIGHEAIAYFLYVIVFLREQDGYQAPISCIPEIAFPYHADPEKLALLIKDFGLFKIEDGFFSCPWLCVALRPLDEKRKMQKESAKKTNEKRWGKSDTHTDQGAIASIVEIRTGELNKKEINTGAPAPREPSDGESRKKKFIPPVASEVASFFLASIGRPDHPKHWPEDKCRNQADLFIDHYKANGWVQGRGKPIKDWHAACRNWIRHALNGDFTKPEPVVREKTTPTRRETPPAPQLSKLQEELNYLYEHWMEDNALVTVISITADHYNFLKSGRLIAFTEAEINSIRAKTSQHMTEKGLDGPVAETRLMKAYAVLQFFEQLKDQEKETVFDDEARTIRAESHCVA